MTNNMCVESLSPLDLLMPATYIGMLLTFDTPASSTSIAEKLQGGLNVATQRIPYLGGRVFPTPPSPGAKPSLKIRWDPAKGLPIIIDKGSITESYDSLSASGMQPADIPADIWPSVDVPHDQLAEHGAPVFSASFFRFSEGNGSGLCIYMHHNVTDAAGLTEVIRIWAQATAGLGPLSSHQVMGRCDRLKEKLSEQLNGIASLCLDELFAAHPEYSRVPPAMPSGFPANTCKIYSVPISKITAIKETLGVGKPTTNTLLSALLWASITRARLHRKSEKPGDALSQLVMAVDGRQRMDPEFSKHGSIYPGNSILYALSSISTADLEACQRDSPQAITKICDALSASCAPKKINSRYVAEVCSLVEKMEDYRAIFPGWDLFNSRDLTITSWANLDLHELDFGENIGKPTFVRPPYVEADGVCIIMPRKRVDTSSLVNEQIDVLVMLRRDDMAALNQDGFWNTLTL
ncbi:transferase family-domain-containing protein [Hypomontagnella monticulosa]|nr:transferase family-domain-containing protein [Hypomontagnella monticulosa]